MGKAEVNKQKKKEALFSTAFDLFTSKGLHKTSISDIVEKAGVAKGTFYLYFSDKYDLCDKLVSHKASQIFMRAEHDMEKTRLNSFEDKLIYITDHIVNQLNANKLLLQFISKNLSWGVFRSAIEKSAVNDDSEFLTAYKNILRASRERYRNPELMLFMIIELVNSTCYNAILYNEPVGLDELKLHLYPIIKQIMRDEEITEGDLDYGKN